MDIKLLNLKLVNFKGVKEFELNAEGQNVKVYGDNATGKTTIADGFQWLLFDKDSSNKKDFQIKQVDEHGQELHNLDHEVEATFLINNQELTLKKVYKEKWTKKRGSVNKEFSGHTTDYFIDGVPSKKKEFADKVAEIIDEDVFKLLTSPSYFNEQLHWKDRRNTLLEVAGDVSDEEVYSSNHDLEKLKDILDNRSVDDHKKVIASKRKEINEELERIPVRIDEINRNLPDVNGLTKEGIQQSLDSYQQEIDQYQSKINDILNGSDINNLKKKLSDIDLEVSNLKNEYEQQGQAELNKTKISKQEQESNKSIIQSKIDTAEQQIERKKKVITDNEAEMERLRNDYHEVSQEEFEHDEECECPTCGQELPEEQVEASRRKAEEEFNKLKSRKLEKIQSDGIALKQKNDNLKVEIENLQAEINKYQEQINEIDKLIKKCDDKISELENQVVDATETKAYQEKMKERQDIEAKIADYQSSIEPSIQENETNIQDLKEKQKGLQADLSKLEQAETSQKRIAELEQQEKDLAAEFEQLEEELYLAEEFIRTKVNLLEGKINDKFKYARFKLFKENINGGLEETCETLYEGVPYSSGLNNAARINVGLDIINTLSDHYGFNAPIFVDNAEAVTELIDTNAQTISLVVSEQDKALRVEQPEQNQKEAV
ncbi:AAA family ATPase [Alkalibacillus almallahensis]|uniref:AAA family ATPase n=1 Tax=Alkalibacillus almallahensis TaxID=1379154 RepID=UPI00141EC83D|nr:AAA family ATPase [Alkalibacillus almallahensis]NIK12841.1 DNA repair exonuclease SbcCD ATPase subunit [Alkalibacillus almallahensis]